jgi:hypothetical protein
MTNERRALIATALTVLKVSVGLTVVVYILEKIIQYATADEVVLGLTLILLCLAFYSIVGIVYDTHLNRIKRERK